MPVTEDSRKIICLRIASAVELKVTRAGLAAYLRWANGVEDTPIPMFVRPPGHLTLPDIVGVHNGALAFSPRVFEVFGPRFLASTAPIECYGIEGFRVGSTWSGTTTFRMGTSFTYLDPLTLNHGAGELDGKLFGTLAPLGRVAGMENVFVSESTWGRIVREGLTGVQRVEAVAYRPPPS